MPRICPEQLLKCLSVLLSPNGGIKSEEQIERLVSLIQKFSTKLVSKCIYISILKATDEKLINVFMSAGGWLLLETWLQNSILAQNWPLTKELLELLQLVPVDLNRLTINSIPKLVKVLSKQRDNEVVQAIALDLIGKWAFIVKTRPTSVTTAPSGSSLASNSSEIPATAPVKIEATASEPPAVSINSVSTSALNPSSSPSPVPKLKISLKDVPMVSHVKKENVVAARNIDGSDGNDDDHRDADYVEEDDEEDEDDVALLRREKSTKKSKDIKQDIQASHKKKLAKLVEKENTCNISPKASSSKVKLKEVKSNKFSDKKIDSSKDKKFIDLKLKDKLDEKDQIQAEKDKAALAKALPIQPVPKLGKIPKKVSRDSNDSKSSSVSGNNNNNSASSNIKNKVLSDDKDKKITIPEKLLVKKPLVADPPKVFKKVSISIEPKRNLADDAKHKTVKTFNSKFRLTGLEEEPPKPPVAKKLSSAASIPAPSVSPSTSSTTAAALTVPVDKKPPLKRLSPPKDPVPEKKPKIDSPTSSPSLNDKKKPKKEETKEEKKVAGSRKPMLLESVGFMDALDAANVKAEPRKRKRKLSNTKETNGASEPKKEAVSPSRECDSPKAPVSPPIIKPFKFYQDTLETSIEDDTKPNTSSERVAEQEEKFDSNFDANSDKSSSEEEFKVNITENEVKEGDRNCILPKSALVHFKAKKDAKRKSVSWKEEECLISVKYFELDETERINVTRTFTDMKQQERYSERENFLKARNLPAEDVMEEKTPWRVPIPIDLEPSSVIPGKNSHEKDIQYAREKTVLQAIYFNRRLIPDTPAEPDLEIHATTDPTMIPLEDTTGSADSVFDFTHEPWPEPKGNNVDMSPRNMMMANNNFMYPGMNAGPGFPCAPFPPGGMFPGGPMSGGDWRGPDPSMGMFPGSRPGLMGPAAMGPMGPMGPGAPGPGAGPGAVPGPMGPVGAMGMAMGPNDMNFPGNFGPTFGGAMGPATSPPNMFNGPGPGPGPGWFDPSGANVGPPQQMMNMNSEYGPSVNMPMRANNNNKGRNEDRSNNGAGNGGRGESNRGGMWKGKDRNKNKGAFKGGKDFSEEFALRHGICKMYLRKGTCPFQNCKFSHSIPK